MSVASHGWQHSALYLLQPSDDKFVNVTRSKGPDHGTCPDVRPFLTPVRLTGRESYGDTTAGDMERAVLSGRASRPQLPADGVVLFNHRGSLLPASARLLQAFVRGLSRVALPASSLWIPPDQTTGLRYGTSKLKELTL